MKKVGLFFYVQIVFLKVIQPDESLNILDSTTIKSGIRAPDSKAEVIVDLDLLERNLENLPDADFLDEIALMQSEFRKLYHEGSDSERIGELSSEIIYPC